MRTLQRTCSIMALAVLVLGLPGVFGCGGAVPAPKEFVTYHSTDGRFDCDCPKGWETDGGGKPDSPNCWAKLTSGNALIDISADFAGSLLGDIAKAGAGGGGLGQPVEAPVARVHPMGQRAMKEEFSNYAEKDAVAFKSKGFGEGRRSIFTADKSLGGKVFGLRHAPVRRPADHGRLQLPCDELERTPSRLRAHDGEHPRTRPRLDLRVFGGLQDQVGDPAEDCLVGVFGHRLELLPARIAAEFRPVRLQLVRALEGQHVGQVGHLGADEGLAEEDRMQPDAAEDGNFTGVVEHLDLLLPCLHARALIDAKLEDAPGDFTGVASSGIPLKASRSALSIR